MQALSLEYKGTADFIQGHEIDYMEAEVAAAHKKLHQRSGAGNDFLGWLDLPINYDPSELKKLQHTAAAMREQADVLLVIGIGGSYLGARAAIEMLGPSFAHLLSKKERKAPLVLFCGHQLSSTYMFELLQYLQGKEVAVNVISKSGTTTEPAIAFRLIRDYMEKRYGKQGAAQRIVATTDRSRGALRSLADEQGYQSFVIPDDVGGRFSVLTPVGLLPIATAGFDIAAILNGAAEARELYGSGDLRENTAYMYAALRNILYRKGKGIEILVNYESSMHYLSEWWKQLFGESEGKDHKGIFPASVDFTTDLHSLGQIIQDGMRNIFETSLLIEQPRHEVPLAAADYDGDGLNYLAGRTLHEINQTAQQGTSLAHIDGGVPNMELRLPMANEACFGSLVYFFEVACAISGYINGVNPFDQPGVEDYKRNMFALLGKPGYEQQLAALAKRLK